LHGFASRRPIALVLLLSSPPGCTVRPNISFKPSPLRGLGKKPALLGRAGLTQALGRIRQVGSTASLKGESVPGAR
jgi:hypothetical protein